MRDVIFKVITLASAINENKVNLFEDTFYDTGSIKVASAKIKCWKPGGHGAETFLNVVENSCNPGFVVLGNRLGKETLMKYLNDFGFGEKTGIDLAGEENGILFKLDQMGPIETATTAFGQGVSVTALQQVMGISAAINDGKLYKPYIVSSIKTSETNETILSFTPTLKREVITKETSELVRYALESVVANGTGRNAYVNGYRVGGKTGTAQKVQNGSYMDNNYILSFVGFMPANNPEYTVYVAVDHPRGVTQFGGTIAAPIAKNILESLTKIYDLKKDDEGMPKVYEVWDTKYYQVENYIGLTKKEASRKIYPNFKIEYSGTGENVIYQSPQEKEFLKQGGTIKLMLG